MPFRRSYGSRPAVRRIHLSESRIASLRRVARTYGLRVIDLVRSAAGAEPPTRVVVIVRKQQPSIKFIAL